MLVPNNEFLAQLTSLYKATLDAGSVFVTSKPHTLKDGTRVCLMRATDGSHKVSTHVLLADNDAFQEKFNACLRESTPILTKKKGKGGGGAATAATTTTASASSKKKGAGKRSASAATTTSKRRASARAKK